MPVERILHGVSRFQREVYPEHRELFQRLSLGQRPHALFITCSDSRIDPSMLTHSKPGDLFICRVIGNVVPPYGEAVGGVSATIEYAVGVLGVEDVIVCGHTDCGVMKGVLNPEAVAELPAVRQWLEFAQPARAKAPDGDLLAVTEANVLHQLENLRSHPAVSHRLAKGDLRVRGWVYHIGEGEVTHYDADASKFVSTRA